MIKNLTYQPPEQPVFKCVTTKKATGELHEFLQTKLNTDFGIIRKRENGCVYSTICTYRKDKDRTAKFIFDNLAEIQTRFAIEEFELNLE